MTYATLLTFIKESFQVANEYIPYELLNADVRIQVELTLNETFENIRGDFGRQPYRRRS